MQLQLQQQGITASFVDAVDGQSEYVQQQHREYAMQPLIHREELRWKHHLLLNSAMYGIMMSALTVVGRAFARRWPTVLIFEDDVHLCPNFRQKAAHFVTTLSRPWKVILWGASDFHHNERQHGDGYYQACRGVYGFFAVSIHQSVYLELLTLLQLKRLPPDVCLNCIFEQHPYQSFVAYPNLAVANLNDSDIHPFQQNRLVTREGADKGTTVSTDFETFQQDYHAKAGWNQSWL